MVLTKIMKRKDASSVFVAIVLAMIIGQLLTQLTMPLSSLFFEQKEGLGFPGFSVQGSYLQPLLWAVAQIVLFEVFAWLYLTISDMARKKR
jgi:hypothetical protein